LTDPTQIPDELIAGDTWAWTRDLSSDYPADTWVAVWYFEKVDQNFSVTATADGLSHAGAVTAATSAGYLPGRYRWRLVGTNGATRRTIESGWLEVMPDPAAVGNVDHRSTAAAVLEMIEAYLRDPTNMTAASYALNGRSLSRWPRADLLVERDKWRGEVTSEVAAERIADGLGNPRRLYVRFDNAR
jgi:hypothetical protein